METKIIASMIGDARIARRVVFTLILISALVFIFWEGFSGLMSWEFGGFKRVPMLLLGWLMALVAIDYIGKGV